MVYLPEGVFQHVLSYCDDRIERHQQHQMKDIVPEIQRLYLLRDDKWVGKYGLITEHPEKVEESIQHPQLLSSWAETNISHNIEDNLRYHHISTQKWIDESSSFVFITIQEQIQEYHQDNEPDYGAWLRGECEKWWY